MTTLLAGVLGLVTFHFFTFENALEERPALVQARRAVAEGHRLARETGAPVRLHYDKEREAMILSDRLGRERRVYAFPPGTDAEIDFYRLLPEAEIREEPDFEPEEDPVATIVFESFGSSAPFQLEFDTGTDSAVVRYDPFSAVGWERRDLP